jgi:hypothetical protein
MGEDIEIMARFLRGDTSMLKCTLCGAQAGTCDCWTRCPCGWSFEKNTACRNPKHREPHP